MSGYSLGIFEEGFLYFKIWKLKGSQGFIFKFDGFPGTRGTRANEGPVMSSHLFRLVCIFSGELEVGAEIVVETTETLMENNDAPSSPTEQQEQLQFLLPSTNKDEKPAESMNSFSIFTQHIPSK